MMIRDRATSQLFYEAAWRDWLRDNDGPAFDVLTPEIANELGADIVFDGPMPTLTRYQIATMQGAVEQGGQWFTNWVAVDLDADGIAAADAVQAASVRADRNTRLSASDWTQVADAPVDKAAWATYRQALRDVPDQTGFPWNVSWPEQP